MSRFGGPPSTTVIERLLWCRCRSRARFTRSRPGKTLQRLLKTRLCRAKRQWQPGDSGRPKLRKAEAAAQPAPEEQDAGEPRRRRPALLGHGLGFVSSLRGSLFGAMTHGPCAGLRGRSRLFVRTRLRRGRLCCRASPWSLWPGQVSPTARRSRPPSRTGLFR